MQFGLIEELLDSEDILGRDDVVQTAVENQRLTNPQSSLLVGLRLVAQSPVAHHRQHGSPEAGHSDLLAEAIGQLAMADGVIAAVTSANQPRSADQSHE